MNEQTLDVLSALERLKNGNKTYVNSSKSVGDISPFKRLDTWKNGQKPYAVIVSCADSRVIPEAIFSAGIGELFVIRVAGNVVGDYEMGSIEYAVEHLGCKLVVVMGHTCCGAVGAAMGGEAHGFTKKITDEIKSAIGGETDSMRATILNANSNVNKIKSALSNIDGLCICSALYHTDNGVVDFIQ